MSMNEPGMNEDQGGLGETARRATEELKETGKEALHGAKSVMNSAMTELKAGASAKAEEVRGTIAEEGERMASSLRDAAQQGGGMQSRVLETMANGVSAVSDTIRQHDVQTLMSDVTSFARRNPALFVAGAAAAGLVLARLASQAGRSSDQGGMSSDYGRSGTQAGDMGAGLQSGGMGSGGMGSGGMGSAGGSSSGSGLSDRMGDSVGGGMKDDPTPGSSDLNPGTRGPSMGGNL